MQQATAVQVVTAPVAVTVPPNQIPVAQYVSVSGAKQDLTASEADKHLAAQNTEESTAIIRRVTSPPKFSIVQFNDESEVASKILKFQQEAEQREAELTRALNSAGVRIGERVLTLADLELAASGDEVDSSQVYQGTQIQYVDSSGDHGYANGSGTSSYPYTDAAQLYTNSHSQIPNSTTNALFFDTSPSIGHQATMVSTLPSHHGHMQGAGGHHNVGQIVATPSGGAYIIRTQTGVGGEGLLAMPLAHSTRASPATVSHFRREPKTVSWLVEHFENSEGVSLPRALMYHHYLLHCREQTLDPVNAASFGKLVRSVFTGLRTRRLGTRGNSKYHYYGIRIKGSSPLSRMTEDISYSALRHHGNQPKRPKTSHSSEKMDTTESTNSPGANAAEQVEHHQKFLGDVAQAVPDLDPIQVNLQKDPFPSGITQEDISALEDLYRDHCSSLLDIIVTLQFQMVDDLWHAFWRSTKPIDPAEMLNDEFESKLSHDKLIVLSNWAPVQKWVGECDHLMYQSLVDVLIPDVLRPIPSALTQGIRNFAKGLDTTLNSALTGGSIPEAMVTTKITAVSAFSQTLRRYTSLNHLAQAARAVLNNSNQITQMLSDLNRVDFSNVQEQASWVCQCDGAVVKRLEMEFKEALSEQRSLEQWAEWLESVVVQILKPSAISTDITHAARQFLLKWCFYSSMVIRDLTLRSAASFGSFHLIRLLYDEYMFYLVEHRVSQATGDTPIAVMSNFASLSRDSLGMTSQSGQLDNKMIKGESSFLGKVSPS